MSLRILPCRRKLLDIRLTWRARQSRHGKQLRNRAAAVKELMLQNPINCRSPGRITRQDLLYKLFGRFGDLHMVRKAVRVHPNPSIRRLNIRRLKWWLSDKHSVHDHTK
jgi:hypothetical protein